MMNLRLKEQVNSKQMILAVLLLLALLLQGCMSQAVGSEEPEEAAEDPAIPVEAATVSKEDMAAFYTGTATLEADQQAVAH